MTIEYQRINHVTLAAPEGEHAKAREFYGRVLDPQEWKRPEAVLVPDPSTLVGAGPFLGTTSNSSR